ncbi:MAG: sulfatase-like hydrolase/transferase [Microthrixaceae bacterium]
MTRPNILWIMTDEERYPPRYESDTIRKWRSEKLPARERLTKTGVSFERHYTASAACVPSRTTVFTGQLPTLHGNSNTDGTAKSADDPGIHWLDPYTVPTLGDWFRIGGYQTHYRGKWHVTHQDIRRPGDHKGLATTDKEGNRLREIEDLYRRVDPLDEFGFSGWIGREPHGAFPGDYGILRDPVFTQQVGELFDELEASTDDRPWLSVASFVNPHDIDLWGAPWDMLGMPKPPEGYLDVAEAPSDGDSLDDRPSAQRQWKDVYDKCFWPQPPDAAYRAMYYWLHELVDREIEAVLDRLDRTRFANDTIVLFTSDHGDLLGSHGGLQQKWYNAYDETTRVPLILSGAGIEAGRWSNPTSHLDVMPTLLGLAGIDHDPTLTDLEATHTEAQALPGRDLSSALTGSAPQPSDPVYFMTEDQMTEGLNQQNPMTGEAYESVRMPACVESLVATPAADGGLWKINQYYERLADWEEASDKPWPTGPLEGIRKPSGEPAPPEWELYDLGSDPEERHNLLAPGRAEPSEAAAMRSLLEQTRLDVRRVPKH